jgi:hypothetical protein
VTALKLTVKPDLWKFSLALYTCWKVYGFKLGTTTSDSSAMLCVGLLFPLKSLLSLTYGIYAKLFFIEGPMKVDRLFMPYPSLERNVTNVAPWKTKWLEGQSGLIN